MLGYFVMMETKPTSQPPGFDLEGLSLNELSGDWVYVSDVRTEKMSENYEQVNIILPSSEMFLNGAFTSAVCHHHQEAKLKK